MGLTNKLFLDGNTDEVALERSELLLRRGGTVEVPYKLVFVFLEFLFCGHLVRVLLQGYNEINS